ncbi:MAG TPA: hypothetical protein VMU50_21750 [Polyangia bacterium]|nr:hypothetical protein [Polyangia bacterium]
MVRGAWTAPDQHQALGRQLALRVKKQALPGASAEAFIADGSPQVASESLVGRSQQRVVGQGVFVEEQSEERERLGERLGGGKRGLHAAHQMEGGGKRVEGRGAIFKADLLTPATKRK